jgi:hypothetical protein
MLQNLKSHKTMHNLYTLVEKQHTYLINMRKKNQYLSYYMHQNIKNAQYILENKMLTSIVTHYKSLELSILNIKSALYQYRP